MMNKFSGYKTAIIETLLKGYKIPDYQISREKIDNILKFFNDFEIIWKYLTSTSVYKYKLLNDKEMYHHSSETIAKKHIIRHICEVVVIQEDRKSKFESILDTVAGIYNHKLELPVMKEYMYKYVNAFYEEVKLHTCRYLPVDVYPAIRAGIKTLKRNIDYKVKDAEKKGEIGLIERDNLLDMGNFFYDIYISAYSNKYTTYMDSKFTKFPAMGKVEWILYKLSYMFKL